MQKSWLVNPPHALEQAEMAPFQPPASISGLKKARHHICIYIYTNVYAYILIIVYYMHVYMLIKGSLVANFRYTNFWVA